MESNAPKPPERELLSVLAERAYLDRRVNEIAAELDAEEAAKKNSDIAQQERFNHAFRNFLRQWSDKRHGH